MAAAVKRADVHRPSAMNPAEYAWIGEADDHATEGSFEFDWRTFARLTGHTQVRDRDYRDAEGIPWANVEHAVTYTDDDGKQVAGGWRVGGCDHCGQRRIRYWCFYLHVPTGEVVSVGQQCAAKLSLSSREDIARRDAIKAAQTAQQLAGWLAADTERQRAWDDLLAREDAAGGSGGHGNDFVDSLLRYGRKNGCLSDAQVAAVLKGIETRAQREEEREDRDAHLPAPAPVVEGRITVEGWLLTTKTQDSHYGSTLKMLVCDDRGFRVWGTAPGVVIDEAFELARAAGYEDGGVRQALAAGLKLRVKFTATVERSRDDETFGFFKRPSKAETTKAQVV